MNYFRGKFCPLCVSGHLEICYAFGHFEIYEKFSPIFSVSILPCLNLVITSISEINSNGDRTTEEEDSTAYMASPPTDACTSFGKHAYTNEDGFGMEYKYNLSFQGTILNVVLSYF